MSFPIEYADTVKEILKERAICLEGLLIFISFLIYFN